MGMSAAIFEPLHPRAADEYALEMIFFCMHERRRMRQLIVAFLQQEEARHE
jgi:hypothetical protein